MKQIDKLNEELIRNDEGEKVLIETRTDMVAGANRHGISSVASYESWVTYGGLESALREAERYNIADLARRRYSRKGA